MVSAIQYLLQVQAQNGGWGYRAGGLAYVEPTAAAILALSADSSQSGGANRAILSASQFLQGLQHSDGGWGITEVDAESGWMTAWAILALARLPNAKQAVAKGVDWLLANEGRRTTDNTSLEQIRKLYNIDGSLCGWSWVPGDVAWVHPTALAVQALAAAGRSGESRVTDGIGFILDRAVVTGGWNLGNPEMFGNNMPPTVLDTSVVLIALAATRSSPIQARVQLALNWLKSTLEATKAPAQMAWGIYALRQWGIETTAAVDRLRALKDANGGWLSNPFVTAVAILAGTA